jgi:hypothetical protein
MNRNGYLPLQTISKRADVVFLVRTSPFHEFYSTVTQWNQLLLEAGLQGPRGFFEWRVDGKLFSRHH